MVYQTVLYIKLFASFVLDLGDCFLPVPPGVNPPEQAISHRQVLVVFSGLVLAMLLGALDSTIVATALPTIVGELGGLDHLAWVVTADLLAQTGVTPLYRKLGGL